MAKYEIDLLIKGSLGEDEAKNVANSLIEPFKKEKDFKVQELGVKPLAYKIKGETTAYYFIYTFEHENSGIIATFLSLSDINTNVLRRLVVNIEKSYGYRSTVNKKKIAHSKKTNEIYLKRKAEWEKANGKSKTISSVLNVDTVEDTSDVIENE